MEKFFGDSHFWDSDHNGAEIAIDTGLGNERFHCMEHIPDDESELLLAA